MGTSENFLGFLETCTIQLRSHFRLHQDQGIIISNKQTSQVSQLQTSLGSLAIWSPVCSGFIKLQADAEWLYKQKDWIHCIRVNMYEILYLRINVYRLDVLWGQPIKLIQVVSTSVLYEYWWNIVVFIFFVPSVFCRASEASNIDCFKI